MKTEKEILKEQMITIAKECFPDKVKQFIDFNNIGFLKFGNVYRIYDLDTPFNLILPKVSILSIAFGEDEFVQIGVGTKKFNHHRAINLMEEMKIIN